MVAAVAIANTAFFMSEAFPVPGLQSARLTMVSLVPAPTAVPAAAGKQQNEKDNYEKCRGIHVRVLGMLRIAQLGIRAL